MTTQYSAPSELDHSNRCLDHSTESRTARCSCAQLSITFAGNPLFVAACHCESCQVRTGSALGMNAYFSNKKIVSRKGIFTTYTEIASSGRSIKRRFCPECGTTVFWRADFLPGYTGAAAGCFAGKELPAPTISAWSCRQKPWITLPTTLHYLDTQELTGCELSQLKHFNAEPELA